jgi:membrane-bound lytic murein transglycosylase D
MYGIEMEAIYYKNRMKEGEALKPGRVLYLKNRRPEKEEVKYESLPQAIVKAISDTTKLYHKVELKQTLYGISQKYGTPVDSLKSWNKITNIPLEVGQILVVKQNKYDKSPIVKRPLPDGFMVHTVVKGETLFKIAQSYPNLSVEQIKKWNNKTDNNVLVGEELLIKKVR